MCGIIGQLNSSAPIDSSLFDAMRDTMYHRGPDGADTKILNHGMVALGHRRLSIIDLSENGKQPMANEDQTVWLTYNGEIYNYKPLRDELERKNHTFSSQTDSEVLIHGYEEWGIEGLLSRILGMFAFAIWDSKTKMLYAARDRFGIKPLYFYNDDKRFIFSSEVKGIVKNPNVKKIISQNSLVDFFLYSFIPHPLSIWENIYKLPPAHYLTFDFHKRRVKTIRYWNLKVLDKKVPQEEAIKCANKLIERSVNDHLVSDVPIGVFLSGGYDSSTVLMHMFEAGYKASSFSLGFKESDHSEHIQAAEIAKIFQTTHHEKIIGKTNRFSEQLYELYQYYDEPFAYSSMLTYFTISEFASKKNKVALVGDGGDELFAGYNWHYNQSPKKSIRQKLRNLFQNPEKVLAENYEAFMPSGYSLVHNNFFKKNFRSLMRERRSLEFYKYIDNDLESNLKKIQLLDVNHFLPPNLFRADMSSMANSIELRLPLLDHRIAEYTFSLNENIYFKKDFKKFLIYKNLQRKLNSNMLNMPKRGFSFHSLSSRITTDQINEYLRQGELSKLKIFNGYHNTSNLNGTTKFQLLNLEYFLKRWM